MKTLIRISMVFAVILLLLTAVLSVARREEPETAFMFVYDEGDLVRMYPDGSHHVKIHSHIRLILDSSPDGRWIIFEARDPNGGLGLYRLAWNERTPNRLTDWDTDWRVEAWTPDGRQLVMAKTNSNQGVLEMLSTETRVRQHLTDSGRFVTISPDSRWIYYKVLRTPRGDGDVWSLMRVDPATMEEQFVVTIDEFATWSPDGDWIYVRRGEYQLYRLRPDGADMLQLTDGNSMFATWSPDGEWMLYGTTAPDGEFELFRMHPDGSANQQFTDNDVGFASSVLGWAANGSWFLHSIRDFGYNIYRVSADGTNPQLLAITNNEQPIIFMSPDSRWFVYYHIDRSTSNPEIYSVRTTDGEIYPIATGFWYPRFQTWSPDSQWIYYHHFDGEKGPLVRIRPDGSDRQVLTDPNRYADFGAWSPIIDLPLKSTPLIVLGTIFLGGGLWALLFDLRR